MKKNDILLIGLIIIVIIVLAGAIISVRYRTLFGEPSVTPEPSLASFSPNLSFIQVESPAPHDRLSNPVLIRGRAYGPWFFEGSFPIELKNSEGKVIASTIAKAQGEWMTTDFVPFTAELKFPSGTKGTGMLVLKKDNPSGLPENDDSFSVPVQF